MHMWKWRPRGTLRLRPVLVWLLIGLMVGGAGLAQKDGDKGGGGDDRRAVHDFSLSITPASGSVVQGSSRNYTVELSSIDGDGFDDEIDLSLSGLGTGLTHSGLGTLSSSDLSSSFTITASNSAALGSHNFTITGTAANGLSRQASATVTVTVRQPTSFSITPAPPANVAIGECYKISAGNAANMTLDLKYTKDGGSTQTITGWPVLDSNGNAKPCPTLASQVGEYTFTAYRNTESSDWISSDEDLIVVPRRDFKVSVSPDHRTVYRGSSGTTTVHVTAVNGFSTAVSLSVSGLPTGVSTSLSSTSVTPTGTSTLTIEVGSSVTPGRYTYTVTGTGGGKTRTSMGYLVVPSFEVTATSQSDNVNRGSSREYTVKVTPINGFSMPVTLSVTGLGSGLTAEFSANPVTSRATVTLTISASCSAARGRDLFNVKGIGGGYEHSDSAFVDVKTFSVSVPSESQDLPRGESVDYTVGVAVDVGFSASVRLSVSGLPSGVTGSFSPRSTRSSSELNLDATSNATLGMHSFTVTGTSHGCTATDTGNVTVVPPPVTAGYTVSVSPNSRTLEWNSTQTYTVTVSRQGDFSSAVALVVSGLPTGVSGSISPGSVTPTASNRNPTATLTLNATCSAATGSDPFTVTGTSGNMSEFDSATVGVAGYSVSVSPSSQNLQPGSSVSSMISVARTGGFSSDVRLTVDELPAGVTASLADDRLTASENSAILTLTAGGDATLGSGSFRITATANGCSKVIRPNLEPSGFEVSVSPDSQTVEQGDSVDYTVTVSRQGGFSSAVALSVTGLPADVTGVFSPASVTPTTAVPNSTSTLSLTASATATGSADFTVTGTGGDLSDSDTARVVVRGPICTITRNPESVSVAQGMSQTMAVSVGLTTVFGTSTTFDLSVSELPEGVTGTFSPAQVTNSAPDSTLTIGAGATAAVGQAEFTLMASSPSGGCTSTGMIDVTGSGFTVAVTPQSADLQQGATAQYTVSVTRQGDFSSAVALTVSNLPTGVTGAFSPASVTPTAAAPNPVSTLTLTASATATGSATFTVTGTSDDVIRSGTATVVVAAPDFSISAAPASASVARGNSLTYTVTVTPVRGFSSAVALTVSDLGAGVSGTFSPTSVSPVVPATDPPSYTSSTLTLAATTSAALGEDPFTVTGTSGGLIRTAPATVFVEGSLPPSLSAEPQSVTVPRGSSQTYTVSLLNPAAGFTSSLALSVSGLGTGLSGTFSPASVSAAAPTSELTITATTSATLGDDEFTITGTGGDLTLTTLATAVVVDPDFSVSVTPGIGGVERGDSRTYTVTVTPVHGFSSAVALNVSGLETGLSGSFSPTSVSPAVPATDPPSYATSTLTITATDSADVGDDEFTITGTAGTRTRTVTATAQVTDSPICTLSVEPQTATVVRGSSHTYTVTMTPVGNFSSTIWLVASNLGTGLWGSFSTHSISPSSPSSELTVNVTSDATPGPNEFTVTGATGHQSCSATATVDVSAMDFSLSISSSYQTLVQGSSQDYTVTLTRSGGFTGQVDLSAESPNLSQTEKEKISFSFSDASLASTETTSTLTVTLDPDFEPASTAFIVNVVGTNQAHGITDRPHTLIQAQGIRPTLSASSQSMMPGQSRTYWTPDVPRCARHRGGGASNNRGHTSEH